MPAIVTTFNKIFVRLDINGNEISDEYNFGKNISSVAQIKQPSQAPVEVVKSGYVYSQGVGEYSPVEPKESWS